MKYVLRVIALSVLLLKATVSYALDDSLLEPYSKYFMTTGYYSPLPGQKHYSTGAYSTDITLNGRGTNGASGAEVFPGMLAAPKSYPFGFKIYIPGIGISEVQDRGGAIVEKGSQGNEYDRLDIWMGSGDVGLKRALLWGKRLVLATVYGVRTDINHSAELSGWTDNEIELVRYWKQFGSQITDYGVAKVYTRDLWMGEKSEAVQKMQTALHNLGYLDSLSSTFDESTKKAIFNFQRDNDIVYSWNELGAGNFGPQTRVTLENALDALENGAYVNQTKNLEEIAKFDDLTEEFYAFKDTLSLGDKGENVTKLQMELSRLGYLRVPASGYFGDVTKNAVMRYQLKKGIISSRNEPSAGIVGPSTRESLNLIFDNRVNAKALIAQKRLEDVPDSIVLASIK